MSKMSIGVGLGALLGASLTLAPAVFGGKPEPVNPASEATNTATLLVDAAPAALVAPASVAAPTYDASRSFAPLVEAVSPAVLAIEVEGRPAGRAAIDGLPPELHRFVDPRLFDGPRHGEGSGFIVSASGLAITNHHVIDGATAITARFADGATAPARVLGSDPHLDIALLQIEGAGPWPYVPLGGSGDARVGDWVVAVGNPLGLGTTVTAGIVSGKGRVIGHDVYDDFLQTDAAINPGNSGGPLFDLEGRVIGVNTAIVNGANTVGFAVPADLVSRAIGDLQDKGYVSRGFIGVMTDGSAAKDGAHVGEIHDGTPAAAAGLRQGDVITAVDGRAISDAEGLVRAIGSRRPGETVKLDVRRGEKSQELSVTLAERPSDEKLAETAADELPQIGTLQGLSDDEARTLGVAAGVRVVTVATGSPAEGLLRVGDVITEVNQWVVTSPAQVAEMLRRSRGNALLDVVRDGRTLRVNLPL